MKLLICVLLAFSAVETACGHILQNRAACNADNCARAITGTNAKPSIAVRQTDCAKFMTATVYPPALTVTATVTVTAAAKRHAAVTLAARQATSSGTVPTYATACSGTSRYSSACSCWGYTTATTTAATPTSTVTVTETASPSPPFDTRDYGCQERLVSDSFGFPFSDYCVCTFQQYCGYSGFSSIASVVLNPPNSHNLGNYQYCYYECNRRASCVGYSYDFRGSGTCKLYQVAGADESINNDQFDFSISGDPYSVAGFKYLPNGRIEYSCQTCPLRS